MTKDATWPGKEGMLGGGSITKESTKTKPNLPLSLNPGSSTLPNSDIIDFTP